MKSGKMPQMYLPKRHDPRCWEYTYCFSGGTRKTLLFALLQNDSFINISIQKRMKQQQELQESTFLRVVGMDDERFTRKVQYPTHAVGGNIALGYSSLEPGSHVVGVDLAT
jgi:hypothetical protein